MLWHEMSWPALARADKTIPVLIPLASCEQHGHHLPLFVDTIQVTAIAERVERRLTDHLYLTPTLWLGSSDHHKDFPGTITVSPSIYGAMIKQVARSVLRSGFKRMFFLNGHGGNRIPAADALTELVDEDDQAADATLALASWWEVGREGLTPDRHGMGQPQVAHACEYETSLMMALRPDLVAADRIRQSGPVLDNAWYRSDGASGRVAMFHRFHRLTASGSMGTPLDATADKGHSMLEAVEADVVAFLQEFATWPDLPVIGPA